MIWMRDSKGLIVKDRSTGGISRHKEPFAQEYEEVFELEEIVTKIKPTVIIGAAAQPNVFTEKLIKDMCSFTETPIIFALSNPTSKAECTAEQAYTYSEGRAIFASFLGIREEVRVWTRKQCLHLSRGGSRWYRSRYQTFSREHLLICRGTTVWSGHG